MLQVLFGDIKTGRLQRLAYFGYHLLIVLTMVVIGIAIGGSLGIAESINDGNLEQVQIMMTENLGMFGIFLVFIAFMTLFFAQLNIAAKRIRDMGLPGWRVVLAVAVLGGIISMFGSQTIASAFNLVFFVAMLSIPSDALTSRFS